MGLLSSGPDDQLGRDLRQIGLLTAVPFLLLGGVLVGYLIGNWADRKLGTEPYLAALGVLMGVAAAALEIVQVVRKASADDSEKRHE
mgnify:CR=1 FL=1